MAGENDAGEEQKVKSKTADAPEATAGAVAESRPSIKVKSSKAIKLLESQGFVVGKTLGSGSYASVKSAYDINRKHKVAIKIINKRKSFDEYLTKFLPREMEAMRTLGQHYALVRFYQIIETTSRYFFIMELADTGDLLTEIKARGSIKEDQAGKWFIHMYDGVKYMHSKGIVHRDIKCENLVLCKADILKITDFGFAKRVGKTKSGGPLLSETFCGSYAYAPPEILKGTPYNPELSDVWSMGVVLFTMVYGRLPFDDSDHKKLLKQVQSRVTFPPKPNVPEACRILIIKIFSKASERVPLTGIKSDAWFKLHQQAQKLEKLDQTQKESDAAGTSENAAKADDKVEKTTNEDHLNNNTAAEIEFGKISEAEIIGCAE